MTRTELQYGLKVPGVPGKVVTVNVKVAYATHESPLPPRGGGVGGEGNGHDFHDRGCLKKS